MESIDNIVFSQHTRFSVENVSDYHVKGSFDPNASCDTEFFGYRETSFDITTVEGTDSTLKWWPFNEVELDYFKKTYEDKIVLLVQDAIDKANGEYND